MTVRKIIAIAVIFGCTCIAWMILGASNLTRTDTSFSSLKREVMTLYGGKLVIKAPECYERITKTREVTADGKKTFETYYEFVEAETTRSDVKLDVNLDQRKKGNLWFPTFRAAFSASYAFAIADYRPGRDYFVHTSLNSSDSIYTDISLAINGARQTDIMPLVKNEAIAVVPSADGSVTLDISYGATGMEDFVYLVTENEADIAQLKDFSLAVTTDFELYDFPSGMMSPTEKRVLDDGRHELVWKLSDSVTGKDIGLVIPNRLNPGEIVTRVSFFAPVSLLFFFVVLLMVSIVLGARLHPMHFFFLAATFFSFHLMFSYFSDKWDIYLSFAIAAAVSLALTVSYLMRVAPPKIARAYAPVTQFVYLVVFSFSFFFDGMTGIIVTICAVLTLFILMQITAHVDWDETFANKNA